MRSQARLFEWGQNELEHEQSVINSRTTIIEPAANRLDDLLGRARLARLTVFLAAIQLSPGPP
jgi:hypothetical protein